VLGLQHVGWTNLGQLWLEDAVFPHTINQVSYLPFLITFHLERKIAFEVPIWLRGPSESVFFQMRSVATEAELGSLLNIKRLPLVFDFGDLLLHPEELVPVEFLVRLLQKGVEGHLPKLYAVSVHLFNMLFYLTFLTPFFLNMLLVHFIEHFWILGLVEVCSFFEGALLLALGSDLVFSVLFQELLHPPLLINLALSVLYIDSLHKFVESSHLDGLRVDVLVCVGVGRDRLKGRSCLVEELFLVVNHHQQS